VNSGKSKVQGPRSNVAGKLQVIWAFVGLCWAFARHGGDEGGEEVQGPRSKGHGMVAR